jgi:hypothetical protein
LCQRTNFKFFFNSEEFTGNLAIEFCIIESLKCKKLVEIKIDQILNKNETLDMEAVWDCIDLCHEAIIKSKDKFIELEAEMLCLLGTIYGKILIDNRDKNYNTACFTSDLSLIPPNPDQYGSSIKGVNGSLDTTDTKNIICVRDMTELRSRISNIRIDSPYFIPKLLHSIKSKSTGKVQRKTCQICQERRHTAA